MNLQRREEIREISASLRMMPPNEAAGAIDELLAHIDTLEQTAAERVIADGSRGPTPDYTGEGSAWVPPVETPAVVVLRRFAERCAQRDHQPDEHIGSAKCVACEAEDALRANQGGAAT